MKISMPIMKIYEVMKEVHFDAMNTQKDITSVILHRMEIMLVVKRESATVL